MKPTHHESGTRLYRIWSSMLTRCGNPHCKDYPYYGERGITVCSEWRRYESIAEWAKSHGYSAELQLDRINNGGDYEPLNCRWVTRVVNGANKRNNLYVEVGGERLTIGTLARRLGLTWHTVYKRWQRGSNLLTGKAASNA